MGTEERDVSVPRDQAGWAKPVEALQVGDLPADALNLNVEGRRLAGLTGGFGKMWQKTYRVRLEGASVSPTELISAWKDGFATFWPDGNRFFGPITGIAPGEVALLNLKAPGGMKLSTGIMVLYADEDSFSFMNPEGHMFAGMITFSAREQDGATLAQIQVLIRAWDPVYEIAMTFGGHRKEDNFWRATLTNLAQRFGVESPVIEFERTCVDKRRRWGNLGNVKKNAAIRSGLYMAGTPFRAAAKPFKK